MLGELATPTARPQRTHGAASALELKKPPSLSTRRLFRSAQGGIRTRTPFGATPSRWCVYQFHHLGIATRPIYRTAWDHATDFNRRAPLFLPTAPEPEPQAAPEPESPGPSRTEPRPSEPGSPGPP